MNKSAVLEDDKPEQTDLAKAEDGMTEVAIDSNKEEKTDEDKKENVDEDEPTEIVVQGKFRNFFVKLFKTRDTVADKVSEEPVKMADCEIKEEYEPEDKPEPNPQVQEVAEPENKVTLTEPKEEKSPTLANETSFWTIWHTINFFSTTYEFLYYRKIFWFLLIEIKTNFPLLKQTWMTLLV